MDVSALNDRAKKLLALALDRVGSPEGANAAVKFVEEIKRAGVTLDMLMPGYAAQVTEEQRRQQFRATYMQTVTMSFGKYKGVRVLEVLVTDIGYLRWAIKNVDFTRMMPLKQAILDALEQADEYANSQS